MPIEFICSQCSTTLRVPDEHAGKQARCPHCEHLSVIPQQVDYGAAARPSSTQTEPPVYLSDDGADPNPYRQPYNQAPTGAAYQSYAVQDRGGIILALGIASLVCNMFAIPGIMAWVMGQSDLKRMDRGEMNPAGRGLTQAGMICGIISTAMVALGILIWILYFIVVIGVIAVGAANA